MGLQCPSSPFLEVWVVAHRSWESGGCRCTPGHSSCTLLPAELTQSLLVRSPRPGWPPHAPVLASRGPLCVPDGDGVGGGSPVFMLSIIKIILFLNIKIHRNETFVIFSCAPGNIFWKPSRSLFRFFGKNNQILNVKGNESK